MFNVNATKTDACMTLSHATKEWIEAGPEDMINVDLQEAAQEAFRFLVEVGEELAAAAAVMTVGQVQEKITDTLEYLGMLYGLLDVEKENPNTEQINHLEACLALETTEGDS